MPSFSFRPMGWAALTTAFCVIVGLLWVIDLQMCRPTCLWTLDHQPWIQAGVLYASSAFSNVYATTSTLPSSGSDIAIQLARHIFKKAQRVAAWIASVQYTKHTELTALFITDTYGVWSDKVSTFNHTLALIEAAINQSTDQTTASFAITILYATMVIAFLSSAYIIIWLARSVQAALDWICRSLFSLLRTLATAMAF